MKNLSTLLVLFLMGWNVSAEAVPADDRMNRGYNNSFIFIEGGIEFAVFPDGQFDFNYLDHGPRFGVTINSPQGSFSFNSGFNYDRFVQYDTYGAVIQIENTPVFYDPYGRVNQVGDIFIEYRNGFVSRLGGLQVFYNRPGVIVNYTGFINNFNRYYVYQPWHNYYRIPLVDRCVVWQHPYRRFYNPLRYSWAYHRNYWNHPGYYNGIYVNVNIRRSFYRPYQRVNYRNFERGRRDQRGRAIAYNNRSRTERAAIATGRRDVRRSDTSLRSNALSSRTATRATRDNSRNSTTVNRSARTRNAQNAVSQRRTTAERSTVRRTTSNAAATRSSVSNRAVATPQGRSTRARAAQPASRSSNEVRRSAAPTRTASPATNSRSSSRSTRTSRGTTPRN